MKLLLDTHALLWWLEDDAALGQHARERIEDPPNEVLVSVVSLWEIAIKTRIGKLRADVTEIAGAIEQEDFAMLGIGVEHLRALAELPRHHRDPFDHLLIAQALVEDATFVTADRNAARYPVALLAAS